MDSSLVKKQLMEEKKELILMHIKEKIKKNEEFKILQKIKKNEKEFKNLIKDSNNDVKKGRFFTFKLQDYILVLHEKKNNILEKIMNKFNIKDGLHGKKEETSLSKLLKKMEKKFKITKKFDKLNFLNRSTQNILDNDKLEEVKHKSSYIEKKQVEDIDNKLLLQVVKKYNNQLSNKDWKNEFDDFYIQKKKQNFNTERGPDLSRRNKNR